MKNPRGFRTQVLRICRPKRSFSLISGRLASKLLGGSQFKRIITQRILGRIKRGTDVSRRKRRQDLRQEKGEISLGSILHLNKSLRLLHFFLDRLKQIRTQ